MKATQLPHGRDPVQERHTCEGQLEEKLEIRNSKQIQMIKKQKIPNQLISDFDFWISDLNASFVSDFELGIWDFDSKSVRVCDSRGMHGQKICANSE
jgi:hypothetical protein